MKPERVKAAAAAADEQIMAMQKAKSELSAPVEDLASTEADQPQGVDLQVVPKSEDVTPKTEKDSPADTVDSQIRALRADLELMTTRWKSQDGVIRSQAQQIEHYQQLLANMPVQQPAAKDEAPAAPAAPTWSQAEEDAFGADLVEFIHRAAHSAAASAVSDLAKQMKGLQGTVESTSAKVAVSANDIFERKLTELAPGWEVLDNDPKFLEWLKARPVFGNAIAAGAQALDYEACAEIFNTYKDLQEATSPKGNGAADTKQDELAAQIAPGKSRTVPSEARNAKEEKTWALSEIQAVYRNRQDRSRKWYTDEEFARLEREIAAAQRDQRVDYAR